MLDGIHRLDAGTLGVLKRFVNCCGVDSTEKLVQRKYRKLDTNSMLQSKFSMALRTKRVPGTLIPHTTYYILQVDSRSRAEPVGWHPSAESAAVRCRNDSCRPLRNGNE